MDRIIEKIDLRDTIKLMVSNDWRERLLAELLQAKIRKEGLKQAIVNRIAGCLDTMEEVPDMQKQAKILEEYISVLKKRVDECGITQIYVQVGYIENAEKTIEDGRFSHKEFD